MVNIEEVQEANFIYKTMPNFSEEKLRNPNARVLESKQQESKEKAKFSLRKLEPSDAETIGELEALVYESNQGFINGPEDFFEDLEQAESESGNFSVGIFEGNELIGYLVAFNDDSESHDDEVAYISDIVVHPKYQKSRATFRLLKEFVDMVKTHPSIDVIEAECRENSYRLIQDHSKLLEKFGYQITNSELLEEYNEDEDHYWVRLEPVKSE